MKTDSTHDRATIYEVARLSGFSTATVSRVMHNGTGFTDATRQTVLAAAGKLGWVPNHSARSLARRRTGIVGLLFPDFASEESTVESEAALYVDQVIRGAERAASTAGDAILIAATRGRDGLRLARSLVGKVDGLVALAGSLAPRELTEISQRVPVVLMATRTAPRGLDAVAADNRGGALGITEHLLTAHRLRDLVFVAGPARSPDSKERFAGFSRAVTDAGLHAPAGPEIHGGFTETGGARAVEELLRGRRQPPQAIVFGNDEMAVGGLGVLRRHRLRTPGDVAVTGFDDIATGRHLRPGLTTVRQPMRDIGETAVRTLLDRIADRDARRSIAVLPTHLVLRASCGCTTRGGHS